MKKAVVKEFQCCLVRLPQVGLGSPPFLPALPPHVVKAVPEIPFLIYCGFFFLSFVHNG